MNVTIDDNKPRVTVDLTQLLVEMPSRLTRVEALVETMREDIGELKGEVKALRAEFTGEFTAVRSDMAGEFKAVRGELRAEFKFLLYVIFGLGALTLGGFGSLWYALAKGFGWIK